MPNSRIEICLKQVSEDTKTPMYERYTVLKDRLFTQEYQYWASKMPSGNNHGPAHISRVMEHLD
jgi:hypothetical protein